MHHTFLRGLSSSSVLTAMHVDGGNARADAMACSAVDRRAQIAIYPPQINCAPGSYRAQK